MGATAQRGWGFSYGQGNEALAARSPQRILVVFAK
jgi:hypothetical protein